MTLAALAALVVGAAATGANDPLALAEGASWAGRAAAKVWAAVAGVVLVAGALWSRAGRPGWPALGTASAGPLRIIASRPLSSRQRVALLEVDGAGHSERLVVAFSQEGAQLLARLPAPLPAAPGETAGAPPSRRRRAEPLEVAL